MMHHLETTHFAFPSNLKQALFAELGFVSIIFYGVRLSEILSEVRSIWTYFKINLYFHFYLLEGCFRHRPGFQELKNL